MAKRKIKKGGWGVVCDGRKAMILENTGDEVFPNLKTKEVREHEDAQTRAQGTDAPGRVHSSVGTARSAVEQTDWHDIAERTFLHGLADRLNSAIRAGETGALFIIAPPRALGVLRKAFSQTVSKKVCGEIEHDYVKLPVSEIERRVFKKD